MIFAAIFHAIMLAGIVAFSALLVHYKKEYSFEKEHYRSVVIMFLIIITVLMIVSTIAFFEVPWDAAQSFFS